MLTACFLSVCWWNNYSDTFRSTSCRNFFNLNVNIDVRSDKEVYNLYNSELSVHLPDVQFGKCTNLHTAITFTFLCMQILNFPDCLKLKKFAKYLQ